MGGGLVSRRDLIRCGLGAGLVAWLASGCSAEPAGAASPVALTTTAPPPAQAVVITEQVSAARGGRPVQMIVMRPSGVEDPSLPVCLALHGGGSTAAAKDLVDLGVPAVLDSLVADGVAPFAVVAVDGGDTFWLDRPDDAPQKMLTDELPDWLGRTELAATPFAVLGYSAGAYGALFYGRIPGLAACAAMSPPLFRSWAEAERSGAFLDRGQWEDTEPSKHLTEVANLRIGVWCGSDDGYAPVARDYANRVAAEAAGFGPGAHDGQYWRKALPEALKFTASFVGSN